MRQLLLPPESLAPESEVSDVRCCPQMLPHTTATIAEVLIGGARQNSRNNIACAYKVTTNQEVNYRD